MGYTEEEIRAEIEQGNTRRSDKAVDEATEVEAQGVGAEGNEAGESESRRPGFSLENHANKDLDTEAASHPRTASGEFKGEKWSITPYRYAKNSVVMRVDRGDRYKGQLARVVEAENIPRQSWGQQIVSRSKLQAVWPKGR